MTCDSCGEKAGPVRIKDDGEAYVHAWVPGCQVVKLQQEIERLREQVQALTSQLAAKIEIVPGFERGSQWAVAPEQED